MPGRLLSSFVRSSRPSPLSTQTPATSSSSASSTPATPLSPASVHSSASSSSSVNESQDPVSQTSQTLSRKLVVSPRSSSSDSVRPASSEHRRSFSMDHLIHPHSYLSKDHDKEKKKKKRHSLGRSSRSRERVSASHLPAPPPAHLDVIIESPPLLLYGSPSNSSGALLSGRLRLSVDGRNDHQGADDEIVLQQFHMRLTTTLTTKKPVSRDCTNCQSRTEELSKWDFLTEPIRLKRGDHDFPFSYLLPGHLPATAQPQGSSLIGGVEYHLSARAQTSAGEELLLHIPLKVKRAILPGLDKSSVRIFPPTNLTGRVVLPSVIHPIGAFPVQMTLSGIVERGTETQTRWRLRKMIWRIEEHQKIISTPCAKHAHKIGANASDTSPGKGVLHQETRIIGQREERRGWKSDFDTAGGEVTMEFEASIKPGGDPVCDLVTPGGLEVRHNLVIELIVAEEFCPNWNTNLITPTGAARVLRMQFHLHVTERPGLGISWDEEMPPVYGDVPASPPGYRGGEGFFPSPREGSPALDLPEYQSMEQMEGNTSTRSRPAPLSRRASSVTGEEEEEGEEDIHPEHELLTRERTRLTIDDLEALPPLQYAGPSREQEEPEDNEPDVGRGALR
ncbi:hypothetical protein FQN54_006948 [Arachnomyces sp. PD_36]|nr:hypothetical protein FQN54_006948 [Arachnomyces sp. PD_36]